jgi:hypothetical protein
MVDVLALRNDLHLLVETPSETMNEAKQGKKPDTQQLDPQAPLGKQEPEADANEASGRAKPMLFTCYNDGASNYLYSVSNGQFTCWRCGTINLIH